ncbi:MAG TPA: hypothetical protein VE130_09790 [Nitrososphaeraceae archaeon]|jgi:hypothetical protein|nr:hypothetical protein [Nitrososphaeraceae archaeon]
MLKRGYIILIAGASLFVVGIALTVAYGIGVANTFLDGTTILDNIEIGPSESVNQTLEVESVERPVSVALHMESDANPNLGTGGESTLEQLVLNPDGVVVNKNQLSENTQSDLLTTFKPETEGLYTLTLSNLGTESVRVGGFFGFLPISGEDGQVNLGAITGVAAGVIIFIIGAITLVAGTVVTILDRRRSRNATRHSFDWGR